MHLKSARIGSNRLEFGRLNIIVGPNNVGKSTLLRKIHETGVRLESQSLYPESLTLEYEDSLNQATAKLLLSLGTEQPLPGPGHPSVYVFRRMRSLAEASDPREIRLGHATWEELQRIAQGTAGEGRTEAEAIRQLLWVHHSSGERLRADSFSAPVAPASAPWPNALNALRNDPAQLRRLQQQFQEDYGEQLVLLDHDDSMLVWAISPTNVPPP